MWFHILGHHGLQQLHCELLLKLREVVLLNAISVLTQQSVSALRWITPGGVIGLRDKRFMLFLKILERCQPNVRFDSPSVYVANDDGLILINLEVFHCQLCRFSFFLCELSLNDLFGQLREVAMHDTLNFDLIELAELVEALGDSGLLLEARDQGWTHRLEWLNLPARLLLNGAATFLGERRGCQNCSRRLVVEETV